MVVFLFFGDTTIINDTFSGNKAHNADSTEPAFGGGLFTQGVTTIINSTVSGNSADTSGGAVYDDASAVGGGPSMTITNSIFANSTSGGNCGNPQLIENGGYNISDDGTCGFGSSVAANGKTIGDNVNPRLSPFGLQNNGGPTQTIALLASSPAVDAIPIALCPPDDQRGLHRPDFGDFHDPACDIGAYESGYLLASPPLNFSDAFELDLQGLLRSASEDAEDLVLLARSERLEGYKEFARLAGRQRLRQLPRCRNEAGHAYYLEVSADAEAADGQVIRSVVDQRDGHRRRRWNLAQPNLAESSARPSERLVRVDSRSLPIRRGGGRQFAATNP